MAGKGKDEGLDVDVDALLRDVDGALGDAEALLGQGALDDSRLLGNRSTTTETVDRAIDDAYQATGNPTARVRVYMGLDLTGSMHSYIQRVREASQRIGLDLLEKDEGIEVVVFGVSDHGHPLRHLEPNRGLINVGDYGIKFAPASDRESLVATFGKLEHDHESNRDNPEAYECFAHDVAEEIMQNRGAQNIVILFGDSKPHGKADGYNDYGCPNSFGKEQLSFMAGVAKHSYFVNCGGRSDFRDGTYGPVAERNNTTLIDFANAEAVLAPAIVAMVKRARGDEQMKQYLAMLPAGEQRAIEGLLQLTSSTGYKK
ncbi:hypothetical protein HYX12_01115 [Candidatus Woesearchaeota archaeon]|nr:hypothetical protein [Candidatus Woesearchaeota archaeon]